MAKTVSITEARERLSELIAEIENGTEEIVICRRGAPVARLTGSNHPSQSKPWPSPEEMNALLEGADTLEEIKARLKEAGLHRPILEVAGISKDDPTWDDYMRTLRVTRNVKDFKRVPNLTLEDWVNE
jgi:prevent-host-death family protein